MKNKSTTSLLVILVLLIGGFVIYKTISSIDIAPPPLVLPTVEKATDISKYDLINDSSKTVRFTRNPFQFRHADYSVRRTIAKYKALNNKPIDWPYFQYSGFSCNVVSGRMTAVVKLRDEVMSVSAGQTIKDVFIKKISTDQIIVTYKGMTKAIKLC